MYWKRVTGKIGGLQNSELMENVHVTHVNILLVQIALN